MSATSTADTGPSAPAPAVSRRRSVSIQTIAPHLILLIVLAVTFTFAPGYRSTTQVASLLQLMGLLGMVAIGQQRNRYLGGGTELTCSEGTAEEIDAEVQRLVEEGHQTALKTLQDNRFKLHEIAHYLQKKETITGEEFMRILTRDDGFAPKLPTTAE